MAKHADHHSRSYCGLVDLILVTMLRSFQERKVTRFMDARGTNTHVQISNISQQK